VSGPERSPVKQFTMLSGPQPEDPFEVYARVGSVQPFWTDSPSDVDGYWVVTRYADVRKVLRNPDGAFSSEEAFIPKISMPNPMLPTESDPPDTRKYRSILLSEMTPDKVDPLEPRMREVCAEIIDSFSDRGHCDVVTDFPRNGGRSSGTTLTPSCTLHLSDRRRGLPSVQLSPKNWLRSEDHRSATCSARSPMARSTVS